MNFKINTPSQNHKSLFLDSDLFHGGMRCFMVFVYSNDMARRIK